MKAQGSGMGRVGRNSDPMLVMPEQFEDLWHRRHLPPEAGLQLAMLEQALADLRRSTCNGQSERTYREALVWVASDDKSWPLSFQNVCATLDLDPGSIRRCLVGEDAEMSSCPVAPQPH